jgi:hypothetical protein
MSWHNVAPELISRDARWSYWRWMLACGHPYHAKVPLGSPAPARPGACGVCRDVTERAVAGQGRLL